MTQQGLTDPKTLEEVQKLIDLCFQGNSILDRIVYQMNTTLNAPKAYEFVHFKLSHSLPTVFADAITDFMMERNDFIYRGAMVTSDKQHNNLVDCFEDIFEVFDGIRKQTEIAIDSAVETKDKAVEDFLRSFNVSPVQLYWKQAKVLREAIKSYQESDIVPLFNRDYKKYVII